MGNGCKAQAIPPKIYHLLLAIQATFFLCFSHVQTVRRALHVVKGVAKIFIGHNCCRIDTFLSPLPHVMLALQPPTSSGCALRGPGTERPVPPDSQTMTIPTPDTTQTQNYTVPISHNAPTTRSNAPGSTKASRVGLHPVQNILAP